MMSLYIVFPFSSHLFMARKRRFFGLSSVDAGFSTFEHITGLSVMATMVEIMTETAIVIVNCL